MLASGNTASVSTDSMNNSRATTKVNRSIATRAAAILAMSRRTGRSTPLIMRPRQSPVKGTQTNQQPAETGMLGPMQPCKSFNGVRVSWLCGLAGAKQIGVDKRKTFYEALRQSRGRGPGKALKLHVLR
jgi:hypothetical protein